MNKSIRNILKFLFILQEVSNKGRNPVLGRGYSTAVRINPYNPLSYITLILIYIIGMLLFGIIGFWKETYQVNPFKWY
jgi:hypothetical protein